MAKVRYVPYTEIILHEIVEADNAVFFEDAVRFALGQPAQVEPTINWVDGFAFNLAPMPPTEDIVRENLAGKLHIASVVFTKTEYKPVVTVTLGSNRYNVRLRDASKSERLVEVARFLKDEFKPQERRVAASLDG